MSSPAYAAKIIPLKVPYVSTKTITHVTAAAAAEAAALLVVAAAVIMKLMAEGLSCLYPLVQNHIHMFMTNPFLYV